MLQEIHPAQGPVAPVLRDASDAGPTPPLTWRRLARPATAVAGVLAVLAAVGESLATVVIERLSQTSDRRARRVRAGCVA